MSGFETLALVAAGASALGGVAAYQGAQDQAKATRVNAQEVRDSGLMANSTAEAEASRLSEQNQRRQAAAGNNLAANGVQGNTGTALDLMADLAAEQSLDAQILRWRGRQQGVSANRQAAGLSTQADTIQRGAWWGAAGTVLTTGAKLYAGYTPQATYDNNATGLGGMKKAAI